MGMGGEAIVEEQGSVRLSPGEAWTLEIPDVSDPGGAIRYRVRSDDGPFDVYLFTAAEFEHYETYLEGGDPERTPAGHREFSTAAVPVPGSEGLYEAETDDGGRQPLSAEGPHRFVVDHTSYRDENRVEEFGDRLSAFVDLTVIRRRFSLP